MSPSRIITLACCALAFLSRGLCGQSLTNFEQRVTESTFSDGLKVVLVERHDAPVTAFVNWVDAGLVNGTTDSEAEAAALDRVDEIYARLERARREGDQERLAEPEDPLAALGCERFEWVQAEGISDKAGILVPARIGGKSARLQLDTGSQSTLLYAGAATQRGLEVHADEKSGRTLTRPLDLEVIGTSIAGRELLVEPDMGEVDPAGTLGLDLLVGRVSVIDFPGERFCLLDEDDPRTRELLAATDFAPAALRDRKLFINATIGDQTLDGIFFDSGSSAFSLVVDLDLWRRLTGRQGSEESNTTWVVPSWGESLTLVGAPALAPMAVGGAAVDRPMVFYQPAAPETFAQWGFPVQGLIGSVPFLDRIVVLDLRPGAVRFGLMSP